MSYGLNIVRPASCFAATLHYHTQQGSAILLLFSQVIEPEKDKTAYYLAAFTAGITNRTGAVN